jgi:hypothetical protein
LLAALAGLQFADMRPKLRLAASLLLVIAFAVSAPSVSHGLTYGGSEWSREQNEREAKEVAAREVAREAKEHEAVAQHATEEAEHKQKASEQAANEQKNSEAATQHAGAVEMERAEQEQKARELAASQCAVPSLTGDSLKTASTALSRAHCRLGKVTRSHSHHGVLVITRQSYKRGARLAQGALVAVSLGPKPRRGP